MPRRGVVQAIGEEPLEHAQLQPGRDLGPVAADCLEPGDLDLDPKQFPPRAIRAAISNAKNELIDYESYAANDSGFYHEKVSDVYRLYQQRLVEASAVDFDDMLMLTVDVLERFRAPLAELKDEGYVSAADAERVALTREGLLRVDGLLPAFFEAEHQGVRYT